MKDLFYKLLSIRSEHAHKENFAKVLEGVEEYFDGVEKVEITKFDSNGYPSMVVGNTDADEREYDVLLIGHLDVVPADYPKAYEPYEKDGRIYARGATDMKGPTVAMITAFYELIDSGDLSDKKVALMLTTDEEVGGSNGVRYLVEEEEFNCKIAFVPDGGGDWKVCTDEKAVYHFSVQSEGVAAHGSRPWSGVNANEKLINVFLKIRDAIYEKWGEADKDDNWKPTINLGAIHGGEAANKVPDSAEMKIDIRHPVEVDQSEIISIIEESVKSVDNGSGISWEPMATGVAFHTDASNEFLQRWLEITADKSSIKENDRFVKEHGAADARFLSAKGIPGIITKPVCSDAHIDDEWIDWDSLVEFKDSIKEFLKEVD
ncbi:M20/M25/M40 family metallo-hydrolase [Candidatus Dojkabacteria bacterium]|nr:M20/M25/M40 family metallo-hydrolase [Candidatus Dojkabacteria bacterium]